MLGVFARQGEPFRMELLGRLPSGELAEPLVKMEYDPAQPGHLMADGKTIPVPGPYTQPL